MSKLLEVKNLCTEFSSKSGTVRAVRNVSWSIEQGEVLGIVGESGSGKSVSMLSIMGLLADNGRVTNGEILFEGKDLSSAHLKTKSEWKSYDQMMQKIRCREIGMIFQDPMTYLNPVLRIGTQMTMPLMHHFGMSKEEAKKKAIEMMEKVGIPSPERRFRQYPHEFSGGMRQRIIIAIALSCNPKLIIADEPTTALDVTIQAQVLDLIKELSEASKTSVIMITHDLGVVAGMCEKVAVMYGGKIVEYGSVDDIFYNPRHEYTKGLLKSVPKLSEKNHARLIPIEGTPVNMLYPPPGCPFAPRCQESMKICLKTMPPRTWVSDGHYSHCWLLQKEALEKSPKAEAPRKADENV